MPLHYRSDEKPVIEFDPRLEMSPFTLFRRLREGPPLLLIDVRRQPTRWTFSGAETLPETDWTPPIGQEVLLFDDDGREAVALAHDFQADGHDGVRALFGGLQLYEFSLDPEVVGRETYLVPLGAEPA